MTKSPSLAPSSATSVRGGQVGVGGGQRPKEAGLMTGPSSPALGKGPYQLASQVAGGALVAMKAAGGAVVLVSAEDVAPGDTVNFLLTAALYKAKAHGKAPREELPEEGDTGSKPSAVAEDAWGSSGCPFPRRDRVRHQPLRS